MEGAGGHCKRTENLPVIPFEERWLSIGEVAELLGVKPRQAARKAARPDFPRPSRDGRRQWNAGEVKEWKRRQVA